MASGRSSSRLTSPTAWPTLSTRQSVRSRVQIEPNLWAHEPDVFFNISKYWRTIQSYFASLFSWGGLDEVMAEEMTVLPGMDELGNLLWIGDHVDQGAYDLIVVDAAPTGETVRLLSLPEASRWWIEKIAPIGRRVQKLGGPVLRRIVGVPLPSDDVYEAGEELLTRLKYVHDLLANPDRSSVRLVLNLEKVSIQEAQRSFTYFHLYGFPTDLIVANRVLPSASGAYFDAWREAQARYLPMVEEQFAPVPVRTVPFFDKEMVGIERLAELGSALFGDEDPSQFRYRGRPYSVGRDDGGYTLSVELPFASKDEISLSRAGDELLLQVGTWRRNLVLPRLADRRADARRQDGRSRAQGPLCPAAKHLRRVERWIRVETWMTTAWRGSSSDSKSLTGATPRSSERWTRRWIAHAQR